MRQSWSRIRDLIDDDNGLIGGAPGKLALTDRIQRRADPAQPGAAAQSAPAAAPVSQHNGLSCDQTFLDSLLNGPVQRKADGEAPAGQPLDAATRALAERGFGCDLGRARVHTGADAAASAAEHGAEAYALGDDIVFGEGRHRPDTDEGRWLLLHELAHVIQQDGQRDAPMHHALAGGSSDASEHAADDAADRILAGDTGVGASLARGPLTVSRFSKRLGMSRKSPVVELHGWITGPRSGAPIVLEHGNVCRIPAGSEGELVLLLDGSLDGIFGAGTVRGPFRVERRVRYRCAQDGTLAILADTAIAADPSNDFDVVGVGRTPTITTAMVTDGSSMLREVITFSDTAPSADVGIGVFSVPVGGGTNTYQVAVSVDFQVDGAKPADGDRKGGDTINVYNDNRQTNVVNINGAPKQPSLPPPESLHFNHGDVTLTEGAKQKLNGWIADVRADKELLAALREGRFEITVFGYASHSGTNATNDKVSKQRAANVAKFLRGMFGASINVRAEEDHFGEDTAAGPDTNRQDAQEQRVDVAIVPRT